MRGGEQETRGDGWRRGQVLGCDRCDETCAKKTIVMIHIHWTDSSRREKERLFSSAILAMIYIHYIIRQNMYLSQTIRLCVNSIFRLGTQMYRCGFIVMDQNNNDRP